MCQAFFSLELFIFMDIFVKNLSDNDTVILIGLPGSGKSSIATELINTKEGFAVLRQDPFLVFYRIFNHSEESQIILGKFVSSRMDDRMDLEKSFSELKEIHSRFFQQPNIDSIVNIYDNSIAISCREFNKIVISRLNSISENIVDELIKQVVSHEEISFVRCVHQTKSKYTLVFLDTPIDLILDNLFADYNFYEESLLEQKSNPKRKKYISTVMNEYIRYLGDNHKEILKGIEELSEGEKEITIIKMFRVDSKLRQKREQIIKKALQQKLEEDYRFRRPMYLKYSDLIIGEKYFKRDYLRSTPKDLASVILGKIAKLNFTIKGR